MMRRRITMTITGLVLVTLLAAVSASAGGATRVAEAIWANGKLYDTIATPAFFVAPPAHSTDIIYSFMMMPGLEGQRSVAESAPGDRDYNGGRWNVQIVVFTPQGIAALDSDGDGDIDIELTSAEEVLSQEAMGNLVVTSADVYFECPLLPRRGH